MKKYSIQEAAKLVANKTHAVYYDFGHEKKLRKVLKLAFPNDKETDTFNLEEFNYFGFNNHLEGTWADTGEYLATLKTIKLSDIRPVSESKTNMELTDDSFDKVVDETLCHIRETMIIKGKEYRRNNNPFHNFEVGARKKNTSREKALDGMLLKHEISIEDMTNDLDAGILPTEAMVNEKFNDNIIYLLLKKAMFIDRIKNAPQE